MKELVFLKLGGSLLTDKTRPDTLRPEVLERLSGEIARAVRERKDLSLVIGHGSGSFGHVAAAKYQTQLGARTESDWAGFLAVWREARKLDVLVFDALEHAGLPTMVFPPSAGLVGRGGRIVSWDTEPIKMSLRAGFVPVVYGDAVFDEALGACIVSTEDLFEYLTQALAPVRILLAGEEAGVWADFPRREHLLKQVSVGELRAARPALGSAVGADVTGGMAQKVEIMGRLVEKGLVPQVNIFSGLEDEAVYRALSGESLGTEVTQTGKAVRGALGEEGFS